jgi:ribosomal protein L39E
MASRKAMNRSSKKRHLAKAGKHTKWAPFWTVLKKFGQGKKVHPSSITHVKRNWRTKKLKIKPRKMRKKYLG